VPLELRLFPGKENIQSSVPISEFRSNPFRKREKHAELGNFVPNHSVKEKSARNFFQKISQKRKTTLNHRRKKKKMDDF
jgi:hypothetical protein